MTKHRATRVRTPRVHAHLVKAPAIAGLLAAVAGCQSYERKPLDMSAHQAAFLARTPESPEVQAFAHTLAPPHQQATEFNPSDGVSCAEAEVIALVFNANLRLARLRAGVAQATAATAGLWEDPTVGVDLTQILEGTPGPWQAFGSISLTIPISGRLEVEKERAGMEHAAELARVAQDEWGVRMAVRRAWSEWSAFEARLATTREFIARVDQVLSVVDAMEKAGEMARIEARLFRIEKATKVADLTVLEAQGREAELRLRQLMGMSPDAPVRFETAGIGPARAELPDAGSLSQLSLESRSPAMLVAVAEYETAEKTLELEVRKQYPDLQIGPGYGSQDGQRQVVVGLALPVPILNANQQGVAEARARREVARAAAEAALEQLIADVRAAEVRLHAATRSRDAFEGEIVPLVDAQYADVREVARLGEVNTLVLLESLTRQQEAKVSLIAARRDEALAVIDIEGLLGPPHAAEPATAPAPARTTEPAPVTAPAPTTAPAPATTPDPAPAPATAARTS